MCTTCESPTRMLWTFGSLPKLRERFDGDWIGLLECPECSALWAEVRHEPYASCSFLTRWPYGVAEFEALNAKEPRILHEWHDAVLRESWASLPASEQATVRAWRSRTYDRYNAIDRDLEARPPAFVRVAADLDGHVERQPE